MLFTVILKEAKLLLQDKGFVLIALIQPIMFIVMFGSSFQGGDINHLNTVVIDNDNSTFSGYVLDAVRESEFFDIVPSSGSFEEDMNRLNRSEIRSLIFIPAGFEEKINNSETGNLEMYIDSSNFLTASSLSGAKVEVAKYVLQNVTSDILEDLEKEKEIGKKRVEEVKEVFELVKGEAEILDKDIKSLEEKTENINFTELETLVEDLQTELESQTEKMDTALVSIDFISLNVSSIVTVGGQEDVKKTLIVNQLNSLKSQFDETNGEMVTFIERLDKANVPGAESDELARKIDSRIKRIRDLFEDAENKSDRISYDFAKLEKTFLSEPLIIEEKETYGSVKYFDYLGAGVLSLIVFFICLMAPALNVISEKESNTLYRLSTTPASSFTVFFGKFLVFFIFGFLEMLYTLYLSIFLYDLRISGSIYNVIIILSLLACASISIGLFISSKVKTMQQALIIVPLIVIPSFLISHAFFPPDIMANFMNYVAYLTPMTFSNHALNAIMIKQFALKDVITDIYVLLAYALVPLVLFIRGYNKIRY